MPRRRRKLTEEERTLWSEVASSATPLHGEPARYPLTKAAEAGDPPAKAERRDGLKVLKPLGPKGEPRTRMTLAAAPGVEALQMDRRAYEKMTRGKMVPAARIDLHGMTVGDAHGALRGFILRAHSQGLRLVLVITGKGKPGAADAIIPERHGVLRHQVPHWLRLPPLGGLILQVAPAHRRHGGQGAYYVYLRRSRA